ncbi:hypothetical protein KX816_01860 [Sphingosinicellaceae bacterium]|nr:hypothetical protein KX816_01860 [Sphingosinicellaceae bacterium]
MRALGELPVILLSSQQSDDSNQWTVMKIASLSDQELLDSQNLIDDLPPGEYQLSETYGGYFKELNFPKQFGKSFKAAVVNARLVNIKLSQIDTGDKHWRYYIKC